MLVADLISDIIAGGEQRTMLQTNIRALIPPRLALKKATRINEELLNGLNGLVMSLGALAAVPELHKLGAERGKALADGIAASATGQTIAMVERITDDLMREELAHLDRSRSSFTEDDV
ncbi:hypothetical protein J2852_002553 [Azospirillum soli]|nr:hypothetical protein [Azospirillum soli]